MAVKMSEYLHSQKEALKRLVGLLTRQFEYVSLLGTDVSGKQYLVQKNAVRINDSSWAERGFVVRVFQDGLYAEYSFNQFNPDALTELATEITNRVREPLQRLKAARVPRTQYPLLKEENLIQNFFRNTPPVAGGDSLAEKLTRLTRIRDYAFRQTPSLVDFKVRYDEVGVAKLYLSTQKELEQAYCWSQGYLIPLVRSGNKTQMVYRTFSRFQTADLITAMEDRDTINGVISQAERLLTAAAVEPGEYDVICAPEISGLIAHEAFGHGVEMDMFVKNRAKAQEYLGKRVASDLVTMHDGAAAATQVSSYGFDDEGVLAGDTVIIDRGILKTGIVDQLSALRLHIEPTGNGKRESYERKAYTRMTNTFFAPGNDALTAMIASIKFGYLLRGMLGGMEDPKNWGIQCQIQQGEEIRDGRLTGKIVSPLFLTGYVPDVLEAVTMATAELELFGSGACGKGHKEWVKVSDGGPYLKTRVRLG
jgi:TldD protein